MGITYPQVSHVVAGNTAGVLSTIRSGTYSLFGGSNITLSQNGQSVSINAGGAAGFAEAIGGNTAGATSLISTGTLSIFGGNNITLSQNGQSISINADAEIGAKIAIGGNTAGATSLISTGTLSLFGGSSITLSQNGQSITINGTGGAAANSLAMFSPLVYSGTVSQNTADSSIFLQAVTLPLNMSVLRGQLWAGISATAGSPGTLQSIQSGSYFFNHTRHLGIYSLGAGAGNTALSLVTSASASFGYSFSVTGNTTATNAVTLSQTYTMRFISNISSDGAVTYGSSTSVFSRSSTNTSSISLSIPTEVDANGGAPKAFNIPVNTSLAAGNYWVATLFVSASGSAGAFGAPDYNAAGMLLTYPPSFISFIGMNTVVATQVLVGQGYYTSATAVVMPAALPIAGISYTRSMMPFAFYSLSL